MNNITKQFKLDARVKLPIIANLSFNAILQLHEFYKIQKEKEKKTPKVKNVLRAGFMAL